ncbi:MAG: UbiA family prenyltransferase [Candidatus Bathyarchaeia archaeon]
MKLTAILRLMRPVNCIMMGSAVVVGAAIVGLDRFPSEWIAIALGFMTAFSLTGCSMAFNDYFDREIDAINEPSRPIPSGEIKPTRALQISLGLSLLGLTAASVTGPTLLVLSLISLALMILYSTKGKRLGLMGNLLVSMCIAIPFIYGGILIGGSPPPTSILFSLMAFLSNTGREVNKGIVDIEGDKARGVRTVAVSRGSRGAAQVASAFYISSVAISILPKLFGLVSSLYDLPVAIADGGLIYSSYSLLRNPSRENSRRIKNLVLLWMSIGMFGFFAGGLT